MCSPNFIAVKCDTCSDFLEIQTMAHLHQTGICRGILSCQKQAIVLSFCDQCDEILPKINNITIIAKNKYCSYWDCVVFDAIFNETRRLLNLLS